MAENTVKRKLTAILCADVKGYSRMMGEDEVGTYHTLSAYLDIMNTIIAAHHGRVFSSPGDAILAQFTSVVNAVECAVEIQEKIEAKNTDVPEDRKMRFRIGVNLGDVIEKEEQIYGDGVNIAARIEGLADPGGICISLPTFDQVRRKIKIGFEDLGEHVVKNISDPVRVYRVLTDPSVAGKVIGGKSLKTRQLQLKATWSVLALIIVAGVWAIWNFYIRPAPSPGPELPDKPSIAILPFKNLNDNPKHEYFCDGLTVNLITQLYKMPHLLVISHQSSFKFKGKTPDIKQLSRELGVRYVLEGSVQLSGNRIRVNTQLIDTQKGDHIWAERYDRELKDVFALQDEIIRKTVTEMAVKVSMGELARIVTHSTENIEALDNVYKGYGLFERFEKESNAQSRIFFEKAIELDQKYSFAIAFLGYTHLMDGRNKWVESRSDPIAKAVELAHRALDIDDCVGLAHQLLGGVYLAKGLHNQAIAAKEQAVKCEPNNAIAINSLANAMIFDGRPKEALKLSKKARQLHPYHPFHMLSTACRAHYFAEQYEAAITECQKIIKHFPDRDLWPWLIASYMELGQEKKGRAEVLKLHELHPDMSIEAHVKELQKQPYKDFSFIKRQIELLRKAGLQEKKS